MCAGVKWLPSSVAVFRDLCLHLGDFIIVAMATTSGICFWDSAHVVKHKWLYVVVSCCVFTVKQKKSISEYCVSHWLNKCDGDHSISSDRDRNYRDGPGMDRHTRWHRDCGKGLYHVFGISPIDFMIEVRRIPRKVSPSNFIHWWEYGIWNLNSILTLPENLVLGRGYNPQPITDCYNPSRGQVLAWMRHLLPPRPKQPQTTIACHYTLFIYKVVRKATRHEGWKEKSSTKLYMVALCAHSSLIPYCVKSTDCTYRWMAQLNFITLYKISSAAIIFL